MNITHDHYLNILHKRSRLGKDVFFCSVCGYQLTDDTHFAVTVAAAKEFMI